ncbi:DUF748 domain-containing protein [Burkholderiaceae bacterium DAT-1]|nr:DUF748 domain-containing protein [Burkholderiaceae bacterium DAT-1]
MSTFRRRLLITLVSLTALWMLASLIARFWLPEKLREAAVKWAKAHGRDIRMGDIRISALSFTLHIDAIQLTDRHGAPLMTLESLDVGIQPSHLIIGEISLDHVTLTRPQLSVIRTRGGQWNWLTFIQDAGHTDAKPSRASDSGISPAFRISRFEVNGGHIAIQDQTVVQADWHVIPLQFALSDLSTRSGAGRYHLDALLDHQARLDIDGAQGLSPLSGTGTLNLSRFPLARLQPYVSPLKPGDLKGDLSFRLHYDYKPESRTPLHIRPFSATLEHLNLKGMGDSRLAVGRLRLEGGQVDFARKAISIPVITVENGVLGAQRLAGGKLDWQALFVPESSRQPDATSPSPWQIAIPAVTLSNWYIHYADQSTLRPYALDLHLPKLSLGFHAATGKQHLDKVEALLANVRLGEPGKLAAISLERATLASSQIDLDARTLTPGKLELTGLSIDATRDAQGRINLVDLFKARQPQPEDETQPWRIGTLTTTLTNSQLGWQDARTKPATTVKLNDLDGQFEWVDGHRLQGNASSSVASGGRLDASIKGDIRDGAWAGTIKASELNLLPVMPYALSHTAVQASSARLDGQLDWHAGGDMPWQVGGNLSLRNVAFKEAGQSAPLLAWDQLRLAGLQVSGGAEVNTRMERVEWLNPQVRVRLNAAHQLNLKTAFAPTEPTDPAPADTPAAQAPASQPPALQIRNIRISGGTVDFADQGMNPGFASHMHHLNGTIQGVSTRNHAHATVTLDGQVDRYGSVTVRGMMDPTAASRDSQIQLDFRNIPIHSLTPYSENFAGWQLKDGRLDMGLKYALKDGSMAGDNHVVIQSIQLGNEIDKPDISHLPLRLAIALLEDSEGRIDLNLPVSGNLGDPEFSYGHLVGQAVSNIITKAVSSPFRALLGLAGNEHIHQISLDGGSSTLSPPDREHLEALATMLANRPRIQVHIGGRFDAVTDRDALARIRVDQRILAAAGLWDASLPLPAQPDLEDAKTRSTLLDIYAVDHGRMALLKLKLGTKDNTDRYRNLRQQMLETAKAAVSNDALSALARQRAEAIRAALLSINAGIAAQIVLDAPASAEASAQGIEQHLDIQIKPEGSG